jgi:undecaprenyl-diphosphatase
MIDWGHAILLAVIQGLTEFLPISSSGHLAVTEYLLGMDTEHNLAFNVVLHLGTLVAVVAFYWRDLRELFSHAFTTGPSSRSARHLLLMLLLGTLPAAILGLTLGDLVEGSFRIMGLIGIFWLVTAAIMWYADRLGGVKTDRSVTPVDAILIGLAQAAAIFPGISRSGATIFAGLARGLDDREAPKFAFLLSIPAILGAALVEVPDLLAASRSATVGVAAPSPLLLLVAGLVSALVGYLSISVVLRAVRASALKFFALWCLVGAGVAFYLHFTV